MELILISALFIGTAMAVMAVGLIFGNRCLRGSCGGPDVIGPDGESLTCVGCPHRKSDDTDSQNTDLSRKSSVPAP